MATRGHEFGLASDSFNWSIFMPGFFQVLREIAYAAFYLGVAAIIELMIRLGREWRQLNNKISEKIDL